MADFGGIWKLTFVYQLSDCVCSQTCAAAASLVVSIREEVDGMPISPAYFASGHWVMVSAKQCLFPELAVW